MPCDTVTMLILVDELDRHDELKNMFSALRTPLARWNDDLTKITDQLHSKR